MSQFIFKDLWWLSALLLLPILFWLRRRRRVPVWVVPFASAWHRSGLAVGGRWPALLAYLGLILFVIALARPQRIEDKREVRSEGYDLILAIDLSGSMLAVDYERGGERINRLQAIKPVIQAFIHERPNDRIGIVVFAGRAYTLAPLTFDHGWLANQVQRLNIGLIEDGTAIGDGLGVALTRLEQSAREEAGQRKGAFVVLLTDGANNRGSLTPAQATEIAQSRSIPVYTIGAGRDGMVDFPVRDDRGNVLHYTRLRSDLDERTLRNIAQVTGGSYFRAEDARTIESAFRAIDRAQKIEFQAKSYLVTTELFAWLAVPGLLCWGLAALAALFSGAPGPAARPEAAVAHRPAAASSSPPTG